MKDKSRIAHEKIMNMIYKGRSGRKSSFAIATEIMSLTSTENKAVCVAIGNKKVCCDCTAMEDKDGPLVVNVGKCVRPANMYDFFDKVLLPLEAADETG